MRYTSISDKYNTLVQYAFFVMVRVLHVFFAMLRVRYVGTLFEFAN